MATGVRPGLSRREQEKARKDIQRHAKKYISLIHSYVTGESVTWPNCGGSVIVLDAREEEPAGNTSRIVWWSPTKYKAAQSQLDKIIPNLKTVEVAESEKDAANLVSSTPVDADKEQKEWLGRSKPQVIDGGKS